MKKNLLIIWIFVLFLLPYSVRAFSVSNTTFTGPSEVKIGDNFDVHFKMNFSNITYTGPKGIYSVVFSIKYDQLVLAPTSVNSNIPYSTMTTTTDGEALILSVISDKDDKNFECSDGILFCDNEYTVDINFIVKTNTPTNTSVKVSEIAIGVMDVVNGKEYSEDDAIEIDVGAGQTVSLNVVKPVTDTQKKDTSSTSNINSDVSISKSNNKFLKKLEIANYSINFDKYKYNYDIEVEDDVNSLDVKVELQNSKAKYTITGNNDLKNNDNKIVIEVIAENGDKNIYTVYVKKKSDQAVDTNKKDDFKKATINVDKKYIKIGFMAGGVIVLIIISSFVIRKFNDKKIDKLVDKM